MRDLIIIGAGIGGLAAASKLKHGTHSLVVVDKARGVGGRMATRRVGTSRIDHGAPCFSATDPEFQSFVANAISDGELFEWSRGFPEWREGRILPPILETPQYACRSGMSSLAKRFADGLDLRLGQPVVSVCRKDSAWTVRLEDGSCLESSSLILNTPPAQLLPLVGSLLPGSVRSRMEGIRMNAAWSVFSETDRDADFPGVALEFRSHPFLRLVARNHTRRDPGHPPSLVAHCSPEWSAKNLEIDPAEVSALVSKEIEKLLSVRLYDPQVHRWRFATPAGTFGEPFYWNPELRLGACGDWMTGGTVEAAVLSGWRLAEKI